MRDSKAMNVLASLTALGATAWLMASAVSLPPGAQLAAAREAGDVLADQAQLLLQPGGHIYTITPDTASFPHPETDALLAQVLKAVGRHNTIIPTEDIHKLQVDPLRSLEVPAGDFFELLRNAKPGSVIVSLLGPPLLTEDQRQRLGNPKAKVVAFCPGDLPYQIDLRLLFDNGLLHAAVVSNPSMREHAASRTSTPRVEQHFQLVNASSVAGLYANPNRSHAP